VSPRARRILRFLARRLAQAVVLVLCVATLDFLLLHAAPGDAADAVAGEAGTADPGYVANLRHQLGLDQPLPVQLGLYLWRLAHGDFGYSFRYGESVAALILERMPATLLLMGASILFAVGAGIVLGTLSARFANSWLDRAVMILALFFYATPLFWFGLMSIVLFGVHLGWLPTGGIYDVARRSSGLALVGDVARHLVLPALTQSCFFLAVYTRLVRTAMLEAYGADYVRFARAKGIGELRIALRHVLRNSLTPLVTMVGLNLGALFGGAVLTETVFSWPGVGRLMYDAVFQRDVNLLLSILVLSSVLVIAANLAVDMLYAVLTPSVELR
jgi:peptide/nickel transport system permease protein